MEYSSEGKHQINSEQRKDTFTFSDSETGEEYTVLKTITRFVRSIDGSKENVPEVEFNISTKERKEIATVTEIDGKLFFESEGIKNKVWDEGEPRRGDPNYKHRVVGRFITFSVLSGRTPN